MVAKLKIFKKKKQILDEKGQALFEAMIFIPIFLYLVIMMITIGNSISTAINQNQATRTYTFFLMKGNSDAIGSYDLRSFSGGFTELGAYIVGWAKSYRNTTNPVSTNFRIPSLPWAPSEDEDCTQKGDPRDTSCIKVFTLYGVCGETYIKRESSFLRANDPSAAALATSCNYK